LTPIRRGDPRRAATISSGKWVDLKTKAKDPSWNSSQNIADDILVKSPPYKLLDDGFYELSEVESLGRLTVPHVFAKHRDHLCICVGIESVTTLVEDSLELLVCSAHQSQSARSE
jgi:hypothetical protein